MTLEIPMRREGSHLVPADQVAADMMNEVPLSTGVLVSVKVPRNIKQFQKAWCLAEIISDSVSWLPDKYAAMDWLKLRSKHHRLLHNPETGEIHVLPKSISFGSLSQAAFHRIFNRMIYVTITDLIPNMKEGDLRAELENIVGIDTEPPQKRRKKSQPKGGDATTGPVVPEQNETQAGPISHEDSHETSIHEGHSPDLILIRKRR